MNTFVSFFIQLLLFISFIISIPTLAATLASNPPTPVTGPDASDKPKNQEPRTVALQVPLDKHRVVTVHLTPTEKDKLKDYLDTSAMDKFLVGL